MIYDVRQETVYHYASPVADARHVLRLGLGDRPSQRVFAGVLDVFPTPVERREGHDFFGNRVTWVALNQPHDQLTIRVAARVSVERPTAFDPAGTMAWEAVRTQAWAVTDLSPQSPAHFMFPSRQVSLDPEICHYADSSFWPERPCLEAAIDLMHRIKSEFVYDVGATSATTTPPMSFALRRGVCQDFSHIMISGLRSLGLPAAYVSGYLCTAVSPGRKRLAGADAMHAWVLIWCGMETGWVGLDPTNDMIAGNDHIELAIGRDYADVAPIDGVIVASGPQRLEVSVDVTPFGG
jgi:transglutaminase-like putative cysteine protease